jgi:hypothetical protein
VRSFARIIVILRFWLFLATRFGFVVPWLPGARGLAKSLTWASLLGALVVALLPIRALAALLHSILTPIATVANHMWRYGPLYVFLLMAFANGYGGYLLVGYINRKDAERRPKDVMKDMAALRAELERMKARGGG